MFRHQVDATNRHNSKAVCMHIEPRHQGVNMRLTGDLAMHSPGEGKPGELLLVLSEDDARELGRILYRK